MNYYNPKNNTSYTDANLRLLGYPTDTYGLQRLGIYPISYDYTKFDEYTQRQVLDGEPVFNGTEYVQHFKAEDLTGDELEQGIKRHKEDQAKADLATLESKAIRPMQSDITGTASEQDWSYLIENEIEKKKVLADLTGVPVSEQEVNELRIRLWRDYLINSTQWLVSRYFEQPTSLTTDQYEELKVYRQALRDLPSQDGFPWDGVVDDAPFPQKPDFVALS